MPWRTSSRLALWSIDHAAAHLWPRWRVPRRPPTGNTRTALRADAEAQARPGTTRRGTVIAPPLRNSRSMASRAAS